MRMNVLINHVTMMELAIMGLMNTVVSVLLDTLDLTVKQVKTAVSIWSIVLKRKRGIHEIKENSSHIFDKTMVCLFSDMDECSEMLELALMESIHTAVSVLLDTLDSIVKQVNVFIRLKENRWNKVAAWIRVLYYRMPKRLAGLVPKLNLRNLWYLEQILQVRNQPWF